MLALACAAVAVARPAPPIPLVDLLRDLSATGVDILYSSELVPPDLTAPGPLGGADPMSRAVEALAAHGLVLRRTGPRSYLVTKESPTLPPPALKNAATDSARQTENSLEELSIFASRYEFTSSQVTPAISFDRGQIEQVPGSDSDALRPLDSAPGLATNFSARPYVRGALLDDVLVEYDGIPLVDPFHFKAFQSPLSVFDPSAVARAEIYTGGFPVEFGTRSGGVFELTPRSLDSGSVYTFGASLFDYTLGSVGKAETWPVEWLFNARTNIDHSVVEPLTGEYGEPSFSDGLGRIRWTVSETSALTLGVILLDDQITLTTNSGGSEEEATDRSRDLDAWLKWEWTPSPSVKSTTSIAVANTDRNSSESLSVPGLADGSLYAERSFSTRGLRSDWSYEASDALKWNFGGECGHENAELTFLRHEIFAQPFVLGFDRAADASMTSNEAPRYSTLGLYGSGIVHWRELETELGLRLDGQTYQGFGTRSQVSPRLNVRYDLNSTWHTFASWGEFTEAQRVDEYRAEVNQTTPDSASRAVHLLGGVAHENDAVLDWRLEIFHNHWSSISPYFANLLGSVSLTPELAPDRVLIAPSAADAAGIELSAKRSFSRGFSTWGNYSFSKVTDNINGQEVVRSWDQKNAAALGFGWKDQHNAASALLGWHSGWPTTPLDLVTATSTAPAYFAAGTRNSARWGSYLSLDLRISTSVPLRFGELSLWADASNVTNRANECCADLGPSNGGAAPPAVIDKYWSPRVFNVGFIWRVKRPGPQVQHN